MHRLYPLKAALRDQRIQKKSSPVRFQEKILPYSISTPLHREPLNTSK